MNFWTKDLSIRDLCDRIGLCVLNADGDKGYQTGYSVSLAAQNCSKNQTALFNSLLKWFSEKRLFRTDDAQSEEETEDWLISDLRKIIINVTFSTLDKHDPSSENVRTFLRKCVSKFGVDKVKEFMEIQLMHHNELSLKLLDWLESEFETRIMQDRQQQDNNLPIVSQMENSSRKEDDDLQQVKLPSMPQVNLEEVM